MKFTFNKVIYSTLVLVCLFKTTLSAQQGTDALPCLFDLLHQASTLQKAEMPIRRAVGNLKNANANALDNLDDVRVIPVVVHIIHNGGSENISKAQVERQIQILNEDYGKLPGSPGDGGGVDTRVRFYLAKKDPLGRCTDGIVRLKTTLTTHQPVDRAALKTLSFWDNTRYLNMYVVKSISGNVAGYSSFPYSPPEEDGIVVGHLYFGDIGTAAASGGRTTTHELGHWFGLYHTFNGGCGQDICTDGDYVCDTPPVVNPNFSCNLNANSCTNDSPNLPDMVRNYMDYTPDNCKNLFTQGQKDRITATLDTVRTLIWSPANLLSTGCDSTYVAPTVCAVSAGFVTLTPQVCKGGKIYFVDRSLNTATSWQWFFPGGVPAVSTLQNPTVTYDSLGLFSVMLVASNASGSDTLFLENHVSVTAPGIGDALPFLVNFDDGVFPPLGTSIYNPDLGIRWELDSLGFHSAPYSVRIDNLINTNYGTRDELELPFFDFTTANPDSTLRLVFWWAYARSDANYSDDLIVQISKDCGVNFTNILTKSGASLVTGPTQTTPFIPTAAQWKKAVVSLQAYKTEKYVKIRFVNVTDGGNRLYLDDIQIEGGLITAIEEQNPAALPVRIFPNPVGNRAFLQKTTASDEPMHIRAFDALGVLLRDFGDVSGNELDCSGLPSGLIFLKIDSTGQVSTVRLIKIN